MVDLVCVGIICSVVAYNHENLSIYLKGAEGYFNEVSDSYIGDYSVSSIADKCSRSDFKSQCVFWATPLIFDEDRGLDRRHLIPPSEILSDGRGVCRDISAYRMAILKSLNVTAEFFYEPNHIYVATWENGKTWRIDNDYMVEIHNR